MRKNPGIWFLTVAALLPLLWIVLTMPVFAGGRALFLFAGALVTAMLLLRMAWRAHHAGALAPHRCATCDHPMVLIRPGELRPPSGGEPKRQVTWRCRRCGRLV